MVLSSFLLQTCLIFFLKVTNSPIQKIYIVGELKILKHIISKGFNVLCTTQQFITSKFNTNCHVGVHMLHNNDDEMLKCFERVSIFKNFVVQGDVIMIYHCEAETGVAVHELMRGLIRMKCGTFFKEYSTKKWN